MAALKARGWKVTLYPFVFMDIAADNALPDPYGAVRQAAYPWRGRIRGEDGAGATAQIAALFGGAEDWGLRRLALHYAALAAETGADGLLIGSEMRGVTWTRDAEGGHPAVPQYRMLAAECRAILGGEPPVFGAPLFAVLDLPPLPGSEADERPVIAVAADPWRAMRVFAGSSPESLTPRGEAPTPARVGVLMQPLAAGITGRWDGANAILVAVEGAAPASLGEATVLAGANAVAIQAGDGWEIVQFRSAELVGQSVWRLKGLLRAQQGTEAEMAAGSEAGGLVVFLDERLVRVLAPLSEISLPLIWRAGPSGGVPGGAGVTEQSVRLRGIFHRPWRPAHLRVRQGPGGYDIDWRARTRLNGDLWDRDLAADPMRFRIRVLNGDVVVRVWEVEGTAAVYETASVTADFPGSPGLGVRIGVSQAGEVFGWGSEAVAALPV